LELSNITLSNIPNFNVSSSYSQIVYGPLTELINSIWIPISYVDQSHGLNSFTYLYSYDLELNYAGSINLTSALHYNGVNFVVGIEQTSQIFVFGDDAFVQISAAESSVLNSVSFSVQFSVWPSLDGTEIYAATTLTNGAAGLVTIDSTTLVVSPVTEPMADESGIWAYFIDCKSSLTEDSVSYCSALFEPGNGGDVDYYLLKLNSTNWDILANITIGQGYSALFADPGYSGPEVGWTVQTTNGGSISTLTAYNSTLQQLWQVKFGSNAGLGIPVFTIDDYLFVTASTGSEIVKQQIFQFQSSTVVNTFLFPSPYIAQLDKVGWPLPLIQNNLFTYAVTSDVHDPSLLERIEAINF